jgi:hypothetical protein
MPFSAASSGGSGSPGGSSGQVQYNNAGAFGGATGFTLSAGALTALTIATDTITTSTPAISATQTWNAGGVTFSALKLNVTNTASAAASLLADLQVGGSSIFAVRKDGALLFGGTSLIDYGVTVANQLQLGTTAGLVRVGSCLVQPSSGVASLGGNVLQVDFTNAKLWNSGALQWSSTGANSGSPDAQLSRDAADILALRGANATTAAAMSFYTYGASPPAAPAASIARLYADTSGGKIRLMAVFPSGAAQQIAIEP